MAGAGFVDAADADTPRTLPAAMFSNGEPIEIHADELDDREQRYDIDDVTREPLTTRFRRRSQSSDGSRCRWYRFIIPSDEEALGPWVLTARATSAILYEPVQGSFGYHAERFGLDTAVAARRYRNGRPTVNILHRDYGKTMYLRLVGGGDMLATFATIEAYSTYVADLDGAGIFFATVYGVLAATALVFGLIARNRAFVYYAVYMTAQALNQLDDLPFLARLLWSSRLPETFWFDLCYAGITPLAFVAFVRQVLETRNNLKLDVALRGVALAVAVIGVASIAHDRYLGGNAGHVGIALASLVLSLLVGAVAFARWRKGYLAANIYLVGLLGLMVGVALYPVVGGTVDTPDLGFVWESIAFLTALAYRYYRTAKDRERALATAASADGRALKEYAIHVAELEHFSTAFQRFVPKEFLEQLGKRDAREVTLGDHVEREMTVLFCDIKSFVAMSDDLSPQATFDFLNDYFGRIGPVVRTHHGFIDKYLGDGFLGLFPGAADDAVRAAIALQAEVRRFNEERSRTGLFPLEVGIGIHRGRLMLATVGECERFETTVVADVVNVAARLEGLTRIYGARVIAGESVVSALQNRSSYNVRSLGHIQVKGSTHPIAA
ncbi:MAG: adenylate/guanylate cyclase domain-containing protein, partial [Candidatus Eremiobacteraeota bacterium]|nr:adenylate/guanylate cyclase domain-containing protein [Candidatus Eremiobacteraeota bacterium]